MTRLDVLSSAKCTASAPRIGLLAGLPALRKSSPLCRAVRTSAMRVETSQEARSRPSLWEPPLCAILRQIWPGPPVDEEGALRPDSRRATKDRGRANVPWLLALHSCDQRARCWPPECG